jgi:hypothetical protein
MTIKTLFVPWDLGAKVKPGRDHVLKENLALG